jgi:hypothetical protein
MVFNLSARVSQMKAPTAKALSENLQQLCSVKNENATSKPLFQVLRWSAGDHCAVRPPKRKIRVLTADGAQMFAEPELSERFDGIRPKRNAGSDFPENRAAFVDIRIDAFFPQSNPRSQAADTATNDQDFHF